MSQIIMLNNKGRSIDAYGTPNKTSFQNLKELLIFTLC